jgi:hypothetical protein
VIHEIRNFSAPDFVLAGKTIDIRAGAPYPSSLYDYRLLSGLCQMPGKIFSAFAAPDDDVLILLHTHIAILSRGFTEAARILIVASPRVTAQVPR